MQKSSPKLPPMAERSEPKGNPNYVRKGVSGPQWNNEAPRSTDADLGAGRKVTRDTPGQRPHKVK